MSKLDVAGGTALGAYGGVTPAPANGLIVSGSVGIGTTDPQHPLQVAGTIGAEEVVVSSTGADYVFDPKYELTPLSEVAGFVKEHHHLPGIPSAEEMTKQGVSLGEMQTRLLAKVEELTLHMIEANKRIDELAHENQELQRQISRKDSHDVRIH